MPIKEEYLYTNCAQTNDLYYWIEVLTWYQMCKLFVLDKCTWYHITVYKQMIILVD